MVWSLCFLQTHTLSCVRHQVNSAENSAEFREESHTAVNPCGHWTDRLPVTAGWLCVRDRAALCGKEAELCEHLTQNDVNSWLFSFIVCTDIDTSHSSDARALSVSDTRLIPINSTTTQQEKENWTDSLPEKSRHQNSSPVFQTGRHELFLKFWIKAFLLFSCILKLFMFNCVKLKTAIHYLNLSLYLVSFGIHPHYFLLVYFIVVCLI